MGTWGPRNFDSDTAADHMSMITDDLIKDIETSMADRASIEPDELSGVTVPCNLELLTLLAKQKYVGVTLPSAKRLAAWKKIYLDVWDAKIDALKPTPAHKRERRKIIVRTFDELAKLAARKA